MTDILHFFERCTYQTSANSEWVQGIAKVAALGLCHVVFIIDTDGNKVKVYDYRLSGPSYQEPTAIVLHEEVDDGDIVHLPEPVSHRRITSKQYNALKASWERKSYLEAIRDLRNMQPGLSLFDAKQTIEKWMKGPES